jgi:hypothetical protein
MSIHVLDNHSVARVHNAGAIHNVAASIHNTRYHMSLYDTLYAMSQ